MPDLRRADVPFDIALSYGVTVSTKPPPPPAWPRPTQQPGARRKRSSAKDASVRGQGLPLDGLPERSGAGERDGFHQAQPIRELAVRHITRWTGVELGGRAAPPTPENIAAVMELYRVGEHFVQEFTLRQVLLNAAKNGCGPPS